MTSLKQCDNSCIMLFGDLHAPYQHPDALDFLNAVAHKYQPTRVFNVGDEIDSHSISFHPQRPDLSNATEELKRARKVIHQLEKIFPTLYNCESNHTSRVYRIGMSSGIPKDLILPYKDLLGVKSTKWVWKPEYRITLVPDKTHLMITHNAGANALLASQRNGCSLVAGHHHVLFNLNYWQSTQGLSFSAQAGCLIDFNSPAFAYAAGYTVKPMLGCVIIERGNPKLIRMTLNKNNSWNKEVL